MALITERLPSTAKKPAKIRAVGLNNCAVEARRIGLLLERDGRDATRDWVTRTLGIYRRAVLDPSHFASKAEYRRMYLASCVDFRRWLHMNRA